MIFPITFTLFPSIQSEWFNPNSEETNEYILTIKYITLIREGFKKSDFYYFGVWSPPPESDKNIFYFLY